MKDSAARNSLEQHMRMVSRLESIAAFCNELDVNNIKAVDLRRFIMDVGDSLVSTLAMVGPESGQIPVLAPGYWAHDKLR